MSFNFQVSPRYTGIYIHIVELYLTSFVTSAHQRQVVQRPLHSSPGLLFLERIEIIPDYVKN